MADLDSHAAKHDEEPSIADDAAALPSPSSLPSPSHSSLQSPALPQGDSRATPHGTPLEPALDPNAALYRAAHDAHFAANNPALALQRWNAYLTAAPGGRFAPEAAFNRALCLVRLGQHQAAVAALQPFASGNYGTYRQAEATRLVEALSSQPAQ